MDESKLFIPFKTSAIAMVGIPINFRLLILTSKKKKQTQII